MICGTGGGGELAGDGLGAAEAEAVGEGDGDAEGDLAGVVVADGGLVVIPGDVTVSTAGTTAGCGPGTGEAGLDAGGRIVGGASDTGAAVVHVGRAADGTVDGCPAEPLSAKLTTADAASTPAVTPAAVSDRRRVRLRRGR